MNSNKLNQRKHNSIQNTNQETTKFNANNENTNQFKTNNKQFKHAKQFKQYNQFRTDIKRTMTSSKLKTKSKQRKPNFT